MAATETQPGTKNPGTKIKPRQRHKARRLAVQALYQWQVSGAGLTDIELQFRQDNDLKNTDDKYFSELLHQVPARKSDLDALYTPHLDRDLTDLTPVELAILRIGAYELTERSGVPYKVVINEAVELSKAFGATDGHKYVNGILDALAKQLKR